jgi:hypothetical protein
LVGVGNEKIKDSKQFSPLPPCSYAGSSAKINAYLSALARLVVFQFNYLFALVLVVSVMELVGCEEKDSAGKIGEQLDKSVKDDAKKTNELLGK